MEIGVGFGFGFEFAIQCKIVGLIVHPSYK